MMETETSIPVVDAGRLYDYFYIPDGLRLE